MLVNQASDPLIGVVIQNYVVRKQLAAGGMGAVYLATHERSGARKAIKILLPHFANVAVIRARFEDEARGVMGVASPYIVGIDNYGALPDGQLYLIMDFLDGETLEDHIARRPVSSLHHTLHIIAQVMSALQSLHEKGIVHRDLKPANIFILKTKQNAYEVRLIDLGISRNLAESTNEKKTLTGMAMGTPGYMAVEQYENAAAAGKPADVYAVAVIVWRMLFGILPWGDVPNEQVLYFKQRTEDFTLPQGPLGHVAPVPAEVVTLLRKTLSRDPNERPSVADFINTLASLTSEIPPHVPSGAKILERVAPEFITASSPDDETVRNVSNVSHGSISASAHWPHRATETPRVASQPFMALTPVPSLPPTANERPAAAIPAPLSTMAAASGVIEVPKVASTSSPGSNASSSRRTILFALGAAFVVTVTIATVALVRRGSSASPDVGAASQPVVDQLDAAITAPTTGAVNASPSPSPSPPDAMIADIPTPSQAALPDAGVDDAPPISEKAHPSPGSEKAPPKSTAVPKGDRTSKQTKPKTAPPTTTNGSAEQGVRFDPNTVFE